MVFTKNAKAAIMKHILSEVLGLEDDSEVHKVFAHEQITGPHDIIGLEDVPTIKELYYMLEVEQDDGTVVKERKHLARGHVGAINIFIRFIQYKTATVGPLGKDDWVNISPDEFDEYRVAMPSTPPTLLPTSTTPAVLSRNDALRDFKRGVKRDMSQFETLKDDGAWDAWNRSTIAQARAQDLEQVLDPKYQPSDQDAKDLFNEKQKFMYAVFQKNLLTDKGKALVRSYSSNYNAQQVYKELLTYQTSSTKASMDSTALLQYVTSAKLGDGKWKGSTHAFILHWQDQLRKYHELSNDKIAATLQLVMLKSAVHGIQELRAVDQQAAQFKVQNGKDITFDQYITLLLSAAQQYDRQFEHVAGRLNRRNVYSTRVLSGDSYHDPTVASMHDVHYENTYNDYITATDDAGDITPNDGYLAFAHRTTTHAYDIDSPINEREVNLTNFQANPKLPFSKWRALNPDMQRVWDTLSNEAKAIILDRNYASTPRPPPAPNQPKRRINEHDIVQVLKHLTELSVNQTDVAATQPPPEASATDVDEAATILAHLTDRKKLPPGDIKRLLSNTANKMNSTDVRDVNMTRITYTVSEHKASKRLAALVDRGANGAVGGADVRPIDD